jgi:hypothetical protein
MSLGTIVGALGSFLQEAAAPRPALSGGEAPTQSSQLPALTLAISDAASPMNGIGLIPRAPRTGALRLSSAIDLADPVLRFPGEPEVPLLSSDRRALQLPHAPLVTADGSPTATLGPADLQVEAGGSGYAVVSGPPTGRQVRPDAATGLLELGEPLPGTGELRLGYFIGQWEVLATRYQVTLGVDVFAATGGVVESLSQSVDRALLVRPPGISGLRSIAPLAWGVVLTAPTPANARVRTLRYRVDYEVEDAVIPTGGGLIARVRILGTVDGRSETFVVTG